MSYSPNLTYFLDRLQGFSTNIFRLETNGSDSATANKIIRFSLPSNALLNMRSFALHFNAKTTEDSAGARLPAKIDSLIERVEVTAVDSACVGEPLGAFGVNIGVNNSSISQPGDPRRISGVDTLHRLAACMC